MKAKLLQLREKFKEEKTKIYGLAGLAYLVGVIADGLGFIHQIINVAGILILIAAMTFAIALIGIWHENTKDYIKAFFINLCCLVGGLLIILICNKLKMTTVLVTMVIFLICNFLMLSMDMYYVGLHYYKEAKYTKDNTLFENDGLDDEE